MSIIDSLFRRKKTLNAMVTKAEGADEEGNLSRWQNSGWPKRWTEEHRYSWNHQDWLLLLEDLRKSPYWPMNPDKVGAVLEEIKRRSVCEIAVLEEIKRRSVCEIAVLEEIKRGSVCEIIVRQTRGFIDIRCPSCGSKCPSFLLADDPVLEDRIWGADCPTCGRAFNFKVIRKS